MHISTIEITPIKVLGNNVDFSTIEITLEKRRGNNVNFSTNEITSKKLRGNHVDFSTNEITSKKVRGNHVNFSTSKITSKKYAEMTWKFVEIWSSTYDVISTANRRGFDVVCPLGGKYGVISLVSMFPSRVMVLKLPKKGILFLQFCVDLSKKSKYIKAIYIYISERSRYALSENGIVYYTLFYCSRDIRFEVKDLCLISAESASFLIF